MLWKFSQKVNVFAILNELDCKKQTVLRLYKEL